MLGALGVMARETRVGTGTRTVTVTVVLPVMPPEAALRVLVPTVRPDARPEAEMLATAGAEEVQVAVAERSLVVPSE